VFFTALGDADDEARALHGLRHAQPFIRSKLAASVRMRYTPALIFEIDHELKEALRIDSLIEHLNDHAPPSPPPEDHADDRLA
jgi:ribosome-binding factor A